MAARKTDPDVGLRRPRQRVIASFLSGWLAVLPFEPTVAAADSGPSPSPAQVSATVVAVPDEPLIPPGALKRQIASEAKRLALMRQGAGGSASSNHDCATGVVALVGGSLMYVGYMVGDSNKNPNDPTRLRTSSLVGALFGVAFAAIGGAMAINSCGQHPSSSGSQPSSGGQPIGGQAVQPIDPNAPGGFAQTQAARQAIDEIRGGPHGDVPSVQSAGACSRGTTSNVAVENGTNYTLYLYLAGPGSQSIAMNPGQSANLRLPSGHYDVGARVSAPNVYPFAGAWELASGCPYGSRFYIQ